MSVFVGARLIDAPGTPCLYTKSGKKQIPVYLGVYTHTHTHTHTRKFCCTWSVYDLSSLVQIFFRKNNKIHQADLPCTNLYRFFEGCFPSSLGDESSTNSWRPSWLLRDQRKVPMKQRARRLKRCLQKWRWGYVGIDRMVLIGGGLWEGVRVGEPDAGRWFGGVLGLKEWKVCWKGAICGRQRLTLVVGNRWSATKASRQKTHHEPNVHCT